MADMQPPKHPMEVLPAMLNLVLLQTSKILREPECYNTRHANLPRRRITEVVSTANQRFHDALDEVEVEILQAKAVMERDLRLIRQKRAERDRANGMLPALSPVKQEKDVSQKAGETSSDVALMSQAEAFNAGEITATQTQISNAPAPIAQMQELPSAIPSGEATDVAPDLPQNTKEPAAAVITIPSHPAIENQSQQEETQANAPETMSAEQEARLNPTDVADLDFESMFNDTGLVTNEDPINFDLDFSTEGASQDIMNDSAFENITMSDADLANAAPTSNEDINSLLPGLENYVNADTDLTSLRLPPASTASVTSQGAAIGASVTAATVPTQSSTEAMPADANFDNLFEGLDFSMDGTGQDDLGDATLGDLDDFNWN
ncbi:hypothetical protein MMC21_002737 [Puttea exsequens]|nr:hypothetical protein [Puttea exsequens]